jgi:CubicO group peptidase (beta-lactamase class C family)
VLGSEFNFSLGYGLSTETFNFGPRTACWGGAVGSMTFLDQEIGLTMSYVMNKMAPFDNDSRADGLFSTTRKIFGK